MFDNFSFFSENYNNDNENFRKYIPIFNNDSNSFLEDSSNNESHLENYFNVNNNNDEIRRNLNDSNNTNLENKDFNLEKNKNNNLYENTNANTFITKKREREESNIDKGVYINPQEEDKNIQLNEREDEEENKIFEINNPFFTNEFQTNIIREKKIEIKKENIDIKNNKIIFKCLNKLQNCGRKTKEQKTGGNKGKHTKDSEDNKIRKIKCFFWKSTFNYLKENLYYDDELLKLDSNLNENLKKDFNEKLFNKTLKNIFITTNISSKYKNKDPKTNIKLINRIYNTGVNKNAINILNQTYGQLFNIFRKKIKSEIYIDPKNKKELKGFQDIEAFIYTLYEEEKEKGEKEEDIKDYIDKVIDLCMKFESWFGVKVGRNR